MSPIDVTRGNFEQQILNSPVPVLVDFWASWCGPCMMMAPIIEDIADNAEGFSVAKINVDEQPELATAFRVMSIPTLIVFKGGQPVGRSVGVRPPEEVLAFVKNLL